MTYRNRELIRRPIAMIRGNEQEEAALDSLVELYGGGERAAVFREVLLEIAMTKSHAANSLSARRMSANVDRNAFGAFAAA